MNDQFDIVVIGSGIAGLTTALAAAPKRVALITRGAFALDGSSCWAQGGIAAALGDDDTPQLHAHDTLVAGQYLNDRGAVGRLTSVAPQTVRWLAAMGARFDTRENTRHEKRFVLGREAAHSRARIVHAGGDASGAEIMRALAQAVREAAHITVLEQAQATDLLTTNGRVSGVAIQRAQGNFAVATSAVVLATGGIGALYRYTTNPSAADGSGIALALRAGAVLSDMEFVQFHPTALAPRSGHSGQLPLLTEALRGAGATLINDTGRRFLLAHSPAAELAPRDVVARAVWAELERGGQVFLDARKAVGATFPQRFPTVFAACQARGIDPREQPIPVVPAEHYLMGGIRVDEHAETPIPGIYAVGECACSGVHGANRLASNSLLEGLVFGRELGGYLARINSSTTSHVAEFAARNIEPPTLDLVQKIGDILWRNAGLVRDAQGLFSAREQLAALRHDCAEDGQDVDRIRVAQSIVDAALARRDSIGAHYRRDAVAANTAANG
ncbi:L-aspartate oxidase [Pseudolysobacter antarcticus]|uniref:L-aspartate oxidase n=1 Tax=Pseudolysobacter antarcticus TaxID=2511995 RepID=A0A411HMH2_9GAMM|nr:L-aspartate oxidase [Pseudolysobacter antarcticus]QBB71654.1 L-aspartate oxidase [Pseudolysobacter antarcticus]